MTRFLLAYQQLLRTDAVALAAALGLERALPAERRQPLPNVLFNAACFLGALPVLLVVLPPLAGPAGAVRAAVGRSVFDVSSGEGAGGQIAVGLLVVFAWDFFQYWAHRAMHAIPCLWELHKLHHSDTAVNATTAYRNHATAHIFQFVAVGVPLGLVVPISALGTAMAIVFFHIYGFFNHMNVRLSLGVFTPVVSGPQLHRIHHSLLEQHRDRNFAAFFPIFDIMFGTYRRPAQGEFPPTGLGNGDDPNDVRSLTVAPFTGWLRALRRTRVSSPRPACVATAVAKMS
ncbi:MAG: hypothetical protein QOD57_4265, partial [Actinomycetota bacterium]|nr:hypothetical protein [Actinomycetota bacterium]